MLGSVDKDACIACCLCHSGRLAPFCQVLEAGAGLLFPVCGWGCGVTLSWSGTEEPPCADGLLTFIGCCPGANPLTHLHLSLSFLPTSLSIAIPELKRVASVSIAWRTQTLLALFGQSCSGGVGREARLGSLRKK